MTVIERCRTCGFDVPTDVERCPGCDVPAVPSRPARQVAGLALPTRSVHPIPHVTARTEPDLRPVGSPRAARSAFSFTTTLVLVTLTAAALTWLASQPRFVLSVPEGTVHLLDEITIASATAAIAVMVIGLLALVGWSLRAGSRALRSSVDQHRR